MLIGGAIVAMPISTISQVLTITSTRGFALNVGYKNSISATNIYESEEDYLLNPGDNPLADDDGYSYDVVGVDKQVC